jgi:hypothetical protein
VKLTAALAVAAIAVALGAPAATAESAPRADVIVKLSDPTAGTRVADAMGGDVGLVVAADTIVVTDAIVGATPPAGVAWVVPDTTYRATRAPNDLCSLTCPCAPVDGQEELRTVGAPEAWDVTTGSSSVAVAVLDGVVQTAHQDLLGKVTAGPTYVTDECSRATDLERSHATGVAGVVGANTNNGLGVASLGWQTRVIAVAVLDECGVGSASEVAAGVRYAADVGAKVINMSLAGAANLALLDAIQYAQARGVLIVAAAGNAGSSSQVFPAAYDGVLAVGSSSASGARISSFSNRGPWVDLFAPGESILSTSTLTEAYTSYDGTSFSAPMVAAAAALVFASHPTFAAADVLDRLTRTANPLSGSNGLLDVAGAVEDQPGGFVLAARDGGVFAFGDAAFHGSAGGIVLNQPVVGAATVGSRGYWEVASDGGIFSFGLPFLGSMGGTPLNQPVVGMAATPSGQGYWLVARDGGIFSFGDARFHGSTGAITLNQPIVGMASSPTGGGYWLVAADGGIFTFGDAAFAGSTGGIRLPGPIVGMAAASGSSYWLVGTDGSVYAFGGAPFHGSGAGSAGPGVVGMAVAPGNAGYWLARSDGVPLPFGEAVDAGRTPRLNSPIVAIGSTAGAGA